MIKIESKGSESSVDNLEYVEPEKWEWVDGYEGLYQVSNKGKIKSYHSSEDGKIIKGGDNGSGYKKVVLYKNGGGERFYIHRLVGRYFVDNPENKPFINHKDRDPSNNNATNLEWCTYSENELHAHRNGKEISEKNRRITSERQSGETNCSAKLTKDEINEIKYINENNPNMYQKDLAERYNVDQSTISRIVNNKTWE